MGKTVWVKADPWDKKLVTTALEGGADAVMVPDGYADKVRELGRITVICEDGDIKPGTDVVTITVTGQEDEAAIVRAGATARVIVDTPDWSIIPLENLIAQGAEVVARVDSADDAQTALGILEHGVWGVLADTRDVAVLKQILASVKAVHGTVGLTQAEIVSVTAVGMGDRVCVDTCTNMGPGEGMLVGNASGAMFLVHAESISNPYVAPRPFRVNAGAVHAYTRVPGDRTRYLAELSAGGEVLLADFTGKTSTAVVGRVKIEKRPLLLVTATDGGREFSVVLQNAETIRLVTPEGKPASVVTLQPGDRVLAAIEEGARHFGHRIQETITEK